MGKMNNILEVFFLKPGATTDTSWNFLNLECNRKEFQMGF